MKVLAKGTVTMFWPNARTQPKELSIILFFHMLSQENPTHPLLPNFHSCGIELFEIDCAAPFLLVDK
jgi:hypothetical protein